MRSALVLAALLVALPTAVAPGVDPTWAGAGPGIHVQRQTAPFPSYHECGAIVALLTERDSLGSVVVTLTAIMYPRQAAPCGDIGGVLPPLPTTISFRCADAGTRCTGMPSIGMKIHRDFEGGYEDLHFLAPRSATPLSYAKVLGGENTQIVATLTF